MNEGTIVQVEVNKVEGLKSPQATINATISFHIDLSDEASTAESLEQFKRLLNEFNGLQVDSVLLSLSDELEKARVAITQGVASYTGIARIPEVQ